MTTQDTPPEAASPRIELRRAQFEFHGRAGEYFGIWIVNVLLTILTLGIYSAWAKVRRQRYFYGNTELAGSNFDYHARPVQILVGRIIVLVLLVAYNLAAGFIPVVGQTVVPVIGFCVSGYFLALELTGVAFQRREVPLRERMRILRGRMALTLGFGVPLILCFLVPLVSVLLMPGAVAGATLLVRSLMPPQEAPEPQPEAGAPVEPLDFRKP
jgi:hypothetical protein